MLKNNPLDYLLAENVTTRQPFSENYFGEVTLPEDGIESGEHEEHEASESPEEEAAEDSNDPRDIISKLKQKLSDMKEEITEKLKSLYPEDEDSKIAEALDDVTSALDLADHHLSDVDNDLSGGDEGENEGSGEGDEGEDVEFSGTASPDVAGAMFDAADKASAQSDGGYEAKSSNNRF